MTADHTPYQKINEPSVWSAKELKNDPNWIYQLTTADICELNTALKLCQTVSLNKINPATFSLPLLSQKIINHFLPQLENGIGTLLIKGLPINSYHEDDLKKLYVGLGHSFGTLLYQTTSGETLHEVKNAGYDRDHHKARGTNSNWKLGFHNDPCDIASLLCVRQAYEGGISRIVSSAQIHNEILKTQPELLSELYKPYPMLRHRSQPNLQVPFTTRPIFTFEQGFFCCNILRRYIDLAQSYPEAPKLTPMQIKALDLFEELASSHALCHSFYLEPGDIWLVNNYTTLHARGAFEDAVKHSQERLLLRLWLSVYNSRPLPQSYQPIYRNIKAGAVRGGYEKE